MRSVQAAYRLAIDRALEPVGITSSQFTVLATLEAEPGVSSSEVARRIEVSAQTMNAIVSKLLAAGLVARAPHPEHGRILELELTTRGGQALQRGWTLVGKVEHQLLAPFSAEERATLIGLLLRARDALVASQPPSRRRSLARRRSEREAVSSSPALSGG